MPRKTLFRLLQELELPNAYPKNVLVDFLCFSPGGSQPRCCNHLVRISAVRKRQRHGHHNSAAAQIRDQSEERESAKDKRLATTATITTTKTTKKNNKDGLIITEVYSEIKQKEGQEDRGKEKEVRETPKLF